jgi:hypothetical protein
VRRVLLLLLAAANAGCLTEAPGMDDEFGAISGAAAMYYDGPIVHMDAGAILMDAGQPTFDGGSPSTFDGGGPSTFDGGSPSTSDGGSGPLTEVVSCAIDLTADGFDVASIVPQALADGGVAPQQCDIYLGHQLSQCIGYNIWSANCHTAANSMTLQNLGQNDTGVFACQGNPETSPAYHTINWQVRPSPNCPDGGTCTCMYGWGDKCCWPDTANPPNLDSADAKDCASKLCIGQYDADAGTAHFLDAGQLVEIPGPAVCVRQTSGGTNFDPSLKDSCLSCCDTRANYWDAQKWGRNYKIEFLSSCRSLCNGFFGNNTTPLPDLTTRWGDTCKERLTVWSTSSYHEQCRSCCYDAALVGNYPIGNASECVSRCSQ